MTQYTDPPNTPEEALRRMREVTQFLTEEIRKWRDRPDITFGPFTGWRRETLRIGFRQAWKRRNKP